MTFGDELIAFSEVRADQVAVHPPVWEANTPEMPPPGTEVEVILRKR